MKIRENLGGVVSFLNNPLSSSGFGFQIGKVFDVIMDETTPSKELFEKYGGWEGIGTILFLDYDTNKTKDIVSNPNNLSSAKPFYTNQKHYPLKGELVLIFDLVAADSQNSATSVPQKYYLGILNVWNSSHHNAQTYADIGLGNCFSTNDNFKPLRAFEGDIIYEGRFGQGIRFGNTCSLNSSENFWSKTGKGGDPITIISNGHKPNSKFLSPYVENINEDNSSLYLTSSQQIPLKISKTTLNPLSGTTSPELYDGSQAILTSDRVVLNAKTENVLLFATNNIELYTKNTFSVDTDEKVVINSPNIFLGLDNDVIPTEPALLGNEMVKTLTKLMKELGRFSDSLSTAVAPSGGGPIPDINVAATSLGETVDSVMQMLEKKVRSKKVRISK